MSVVGTSVDGDLPRKKLRKGTHSCWECRRRKVRCVFKRESDSTCKGCIARALKCQSQKYVDEENVESSTPRTIPDRVGRLEALMETVMQRFNQDERTVIGGSCDVPGPASGGCTVPQTAPVLSLFNNSILDSDIDNGEPGKSYPESTPNITPNGKIKPLSKRERICRTLMALIPSQEHLEAVLAATSEWWSTWQKQYPGIYSDASSSAEFISQAMAESGPAGIANALLCVALGIQQLPSNFDFNIIEPFSSGKDLVAKYTANVTSLVISDDELVTSIDGLECLTLAAKIYLNEGKPHRAWLNFRRAMHIAEIIGLHRKSTRSKIGADGISIARKKSIWWQVYQGDRLLSLLLGLSHSLPDAFCDLDEEDGISEMTYIRQLAIIANRIIDRNLAVVDPSFTLTLEIDMQMERLSNHLPQSWWALPSDMILSDPIPKDGPSLIIRFWSQFWHFQVEMLLHLPFMLRSTIETKFDYSRSMCLKASREMIRRFLFIKKNAHMAFTSCHMVEFQVFLAALVIQLNILRNKATRCATEDYQQTVRDEKVIDDIMSEMTSRGDVSGVAEQALEVLKILKAVERKGGPTGHRFRLVIPYFGTIFVTKGCKIANKELVGTNEPPVVPGGATYREPNATAYQSFATVPESTMPSNYSLDHPQIYFSSNQTLPNNFIEHDWSFLGNLDTPLDYTRIADLDSTWDWYMDDSLQSL